MPLAQGARVGPYEILSRIGAGGMGEVYRARDTKLHRDVAIKVLPADVATDPERLARFEREARTLAALNDPHIAQIYGLEGDALVMELVEGEDLSTRIGRGPIPIDEAIAIARQIAEALESAHDVGIVHRDLKPANVKVRADGAVKVLDFGLAKALDRSGGPEATVTSPVMTHAGVILGTAAYMSPEQARGKPVDKRADIWAFGVVLYEMLSGERAFPGDTVTDVIAAVVTREPNWNALPSTTPQRIRELLARCLEKDQRLRLRDIGEARIALSASHQHATAVATARARRLATRDRVLIASLAALVVLAAAGAWMLKPTPIVPLRKVEVSLPVDGTIFTLSRDGRSIAYFARGHLWVRDLSSLEPRDLGPAPLSSRAAIAWSPDSSAIAYNTADGKFWTVAASGGAALMLCTIPETRQLMGVDWRRDDSIVFAVWRGNLYEVPAAGGEPRALITIAPGKEVDFHFPIALPDGRVLVTTHLEPPATGGGGSYTLDVIDGSARETILAQSAFHPFAYLDAGYLLTSRFDANQGIWALPYRGDGSPRAEDAFLVAAGAGLPSADRRDTLLYSLPPSGPQLRELVWVDRTGRVTGQVGSANDLANPSLAPDGSRVAFTARVDNTRDIWVRDVTSGADTRLSFEADDEGRPTWFPSGRRIVYNVAGSAGVQLVTRDVGGASERQDLVPGMSAQVSRDGRYMAFYVDERGRNRLRYVTVDPDGTVSAAVPLFNSSEPDAASPTFSPDGRLLAYVERQPSGNMEVFVTRFPSGEGRLQISAGGGRAALWAANGELFYLAGSTDGPKQMMAVRIDERDTLRAHLPLKLFDIGEDIEANYSIANFDVTADGKQLVMVRRAARAGPAARWVLVQNWLAEFNQTR